ncbi:MAG: hypothetical protein MI924_24970 [Chloroflexales bacterium]|nr:hypothetical protein [Chloroflexales bacterium]
MRSLLDLQEFPGALQSASGFLPAVFRIETLVQDDPRLDTNGRATPPASLETGIVFEGVHFTYPGSSAPTLRGLNHEWTAPRVRLAHRPRSFRRRYPIPPHWDAAAAMQPRDHSDGGDSSSALDLDTVLQHMLLNGAWLHARPAANQPRIGVQNHTQQRARPHQ